MRLYILVALFLLMSDSCLGGGGSATTTKPVKSGKVTGNSTAKPPHGPKNATASLIITRLTRTTTKAGKTVSSKATTVAAHGSAGHNDHSGQNNHGRSTQQSNATQKPTSKTTIGHNQHPSNVTHASVTHVDSNHGHENAPTHNNTSNSGHSHPSYAAGENDSSSEESQEQSGSHGSGSGSSSGSHGSHGSGESGEGHDSEHGEHHVPPPSYQLVPHTYSYKPEGFSIYTTSAGLKSAVVGFYYTTIDQYDRYLMRVRYHGHPEFATLKLKINKTDSNELLMKNFLDASYIVCVTLFSSSGLPEYPPLSTSDMCIDVTVGEEHPIGEHHGSTGLLSPLLLAVAFVLLIVIIVGTKIKKAYLKRAAKKKLKKEKEEKEMAADANRRPTLTERRKSIIDVVFRGGEAKLEKSPTEMYLEDALKRTSKEVAPKWLAAAKMCEIVNSNSSNDPISSQSRPTGQRVYENRAYDNYCEDEDEDDQEEDIDRYYEMQFSSSDLEEDQDGYIHERRPVPRGRYSSDARALNSVQTLSHVLNDKPWTVRQQQVPESIEKF